MGYDAEQIGVLQVLAEGSRRVHVPLSSIGSFTTYMDPEQLKAVKELAETGDLRLSHMPNTPWEAPSEHDGWSCHRSANLYRLTQQGLEHVVGLQQQGLVH